MSVFTETGEVCDIIAKSMDINKHASYYIHIITALTFLLYTHIYLTISRWEQEASSSPLAGCWSSTSLQNVVMSVILSSK